MRSQLLYHWTSEFWLERSFNIYLPFQDEDVYQNVKMNVGYLRNDVFKLFYQTPENADLYPCYIHRSTKFRLNGKEIYYIVYGKAIMCQFATPIVAKETYDILKHCRNTSSMP